MESILEPSSDQTTIGLLLIGFLFGLYHAREADHLAAVSAIVSERKNILAASIVGGFWGLGHTISLFAVGALVIFAKLQISESAEAWLEGIVGIMLVLLGINAIRKIFTAEKVHSHAHEHNGHVHTHVHAHHDESAETSHHRFAPRTVAVGMVHGLAGSAGLMLLVLPTIPSPAVALLYIAIFGIGSIAGMMLMSLVLGAPLYFTSGRLTWANKALRLAAGLFSLTWGALLINEKLLTG